MNEGVPKMPESANENREPVENEAVLSPEEKAERLAYGVKVYEKLSAYDIKNKDEITAAENQDRKMLNAELGAVMMDTSFSWQELKEKNLPWDPYLEMVRQKAANDNRPPAEPELAEAS